MIVETICFAMSMAFQARSQSIARMMSMEVLKAIPNKPRIIIDILAVVNSSIYESIDFVEIDSMNESQIYANLSIVRLKRIGWFEWKRWISNVLKRKQHILGHSVPVSVNG